MEILKDQAVLNISNDLIKIEELLNTENIVYGKSIEIKNGNDRPKWTGCELTINELDKENAYLCHQLIFSFADSLITIPENSLLLIKQHKNQYQWLKASFVNTNHEVLIITFSSTIIFTCPDKIQKKKISSLDCLDLNSRNNLPFFIGENNKNYKSYSTSMVIKSIPK